MAAKQICVTEDEFDQMEKEILKQVTNVSKSLVDTLKFKMIYGASVTKTENRKTAAALKKFRAENWDLKLPRKEAYRKYVSLHKQA